ncbi:MAG: UDP-galactopyranose mutase [Eubacteriales bacterium]|nr:UDP-galactopyranose mutase [Eubacteriales bacterium]
MYDYIFVGAGLFSATLSNLILKRNSDAKILIIEKRKHIGGNIYTENIEGINVHKYGAHIFHTSNKKVWDYVNSFATFNRFTNSPIAFYKGESYNLPFNMNTFSKMWNIKTPKEAKEIIEKQKKEITNTPTNLEEQAISLVGRDIYEKLIKGYTEKQWGRDCKELPPFIIKRLPVRFIYDNNYFNDSYQGIPIGGYTQMIKNMLGNAKIILNTNYLLNKNEFEAKKIIFTGPIDEYFNYSLGKLEYRSLKFESETLDEENHQGVAVVNYTEKNIPYTRSIEHKHFENTISNKTIVTKEYPCDWNEGMEAYYPINDEKNQLLYDKYKQLSKNENVIFGGRLGEYKYYDMDKIIERAYEYEEIIN